MDNVDILIIGSGIAGLSYALEVSHLGRVLVLCKAEAIEGNTRYAQGGIASVTDADDSFESHIADTLDAGAGICHEDIVRLVVTSAPDRIASLASLGARFDRVGGSDRYALGREGGHSARRILHAGDATGAEIQRALVEAVKNHPNITILTNQVAIDLVVNNGQNGREVIGVHSLDRATGAVNTFGARVTMLATGGAGKVYLYTSNPDVATGDGIAMAYRAGAPIANMEFFQFHPTCLYHPAAKSFLLTEALRGEGARLLTVRGERFMPQYDERAELAPRDIVARAIDDTMKRFGDEHVLLDISHRDPEFVRNRFPTICQHLSSYGFDLTAGPVPVVPAAHYCCGGVVTDAIGATGVGRLFCAGETACTGLHGANRLASNSLLEALVFSHRAAERTKEIFSALPPPPSPPPWDYVGSVKSSEEVLVGFNWDEVRRMMWHLVGIVRSNKRLGGAKTRVQVIKEEVREYYWRYHLTQDLIELRNIIQLAEIIIVSALSREESRGLHYTIDYPALDDRRFKRDTVLRSGSDGTPIVVAP